jgi:hypothetical protein
LVNGYPDGETKELYKEILEKKRKDNDDPDPSVFEVVDGQQRTRTILEYMDQKPPSEDHYRGTWLKPFDALVETPLAKGRSYVKLNPDQQNRFDQYSLSVMVLEDATIGEIREMFLRLQNGTPLNAQEKRDAMGSDVGAKARLLAGMPFFATSVAFSSDAGDHRRVASQMMLLEHRGRICPCTSQRLDKFYKEHDDGNKLDAILTNRVKRIVEMLGMIFPSRSPDLNRSYALGLYWALSRVLQNYSIADIELPKIGDNFVNLNLARLEARSRDYAKKPDDDVFEELSLSMSHGTDGTENIEARHDILTRFLFAGVTLTSLPKLDPKRGFTHEEKLILYHKAGGKCELACGGAKCGRSIEFDDAAIDHTVPHSRGGKTELSNGRYASQRCNIARGVREDFDPAKDCCQLAPEPPPGPEAPNGATKAGSTL